MTPVIRLVPEQAAGQIAKAGEQLQSPSQAAPGGGVDARITAAVGTQVDSSRQAISEAGSSATTGQSAAKGLGAQDHANAAKTKGVDTNLAGPRARPDAYIEPKPPPAKPWRPCWIGSPDADVKAVCPSDTSDVEYFDKDGDLVSRDVGTGATTVIDHPGMNPPPEAPGDCYLPSAGADRSICAPNTDMWIYPGPGGSQVTESLEHPGSDDRYFTIQHPGPMDPGNQTVIRPGGK